MLRCPRCKSLFIQYYGDFGFVGEEKKCVSCGYTGAEFLFERPHKGKLSYVEKEMLDEAKENPPLPSWAIMLPWLAFFLETTAFTGFYYILALAFLVSLATREPFPLEALPHAVIALFLFILLAFLILVRSHDLHPTRKHSRRAR